MNKRTEQEIRYETALLELALAIEQGKIQGVYEEVADILFGELTLVENSPTSKKK